LAGRRAGQIESALPVRRATTPPVPSASRPTAQRRGVGQQATQHIASVRPAGIVAQQRVEFVSTSTAFLQQRFARRRLASRSGARSPSATGMAPTSTSSIGRRAMARTPRVP
jgi:hypothetical protein